MGKFLFILLALYITTPSFGTRWIIGHGQTYTKPSEIVNLIADTDTIYIAPGVYEQDACKWKNKNLVFIGMGTSQWKTTMKYTGNIPNGKGIWVFENPGSNDNIEIQNIDFEGAQVSDNDGGNGAGIRFQAKNIILRNVGFRNCQNGLLEGHGAVTGSNVEIYNCEFYNNGYQEENNSQHSGYEHNIYISASADTFWVENSFFHHPRGQGNSLKTRALNSFILYNMFDEEDGYGSYEINIAQGGNNIIMGNVIIQGNEGSNHSIVGYDEAINPVNEFYFINNTVINKFPGNNRYFNISPADGITTFKVYNNIFASVPAANNTFIAGYVPSGIDTSNNYFATDFKQAGFTDALNNDFSIREDALHLIDQGINAASTNTGFELLPLFSYNGYDQLPIARHSYGSAIDIGAFEYEFVSGIKRIPSIPVSITPNPNKGIFEIKSPDIIDKRIEIVDLFGKPIKFARADMSEDMIRIDLKNQFTGILVVIIHTGNQKTLNKVVVI